ncbi:MAG: hypothetical protein ACRDMV_01750 [Streptosporangiales bacterium]
MKWTRRRNRQYRTPANEAVRQVGVYAAVPSGLAAAELYQASGSLPLAVVGGVTAVSLPAMAAHRMGKRVGYGAGYRDGSRDAVGHDPNGGTQQARRPGWAERLAKITRQHGREVATSTDPARTLVQRDRDLAPGEVRHYSKAGDAVRNALSTEKGRQMRRADRATRQWEAGKRGRDQRLR